MAIEYVAAPHAHDHSSVNRIMAHVCIALLPCTLFAFTLYGYAAINLFIITVGSAVLWESLCLKLMGLPQSQLKDSSALLTGWLIALTLPPWAPWWIGVGGSFIAIIIGKQIFGGIGQNVFNPAMLARVALLISFPVQMTTWISPDVGFYGMPLSQSLSITFGLTDIPDGMTGASSLGHLKTELSKGLGAVEVLSNDFNLFNSMMGNTYSSMGESSALLVLLGGLWLLVMRIISWHIPVAMLGSTALLATLSHWIDPDRFASAEFHLFSGAMMLGAFFIATDLVTSPSSKGGQLVFGAGCGVLVFVIRTWGSFPEGVGFAVLFMNALTPLIDIYFKPRVYGRTLKGSPNKPNQTSGVKS
ncbi:MAG: RnfABCDGE type electron transport complex subunit D [Pseudomonadales bacterium]|nr:RnfABCDGE type electron transport complex subunit D [Pseudomonadales bacterium]